MRRSRQDPGRHDLDRSRGAPTEEERWSRRCVGLNVPTQEELTEIEPSSRLYERDGALYMTSAVCGIADGDPTTTPLSFVLADNRLITVRYATPASACSWSMFGASRTCARRNHRDGADARHDHRPPRRRARGPGPELERISAHVFERRLEDRQIPATRLTALLTRIGQAQTLLAKIRYSTVSTSRMLSFLNGSSKLHEDALKTRAGMSRASTPTLHPQHCKFQSDI